MLGIRRSQGGCRQVGSGQQQPSALSIQHSALQQPRECNENLWNTEERR